MGTVQVLSIGLEPLHRVSVRHAVGMLMRRVAEIHEADGQNAVFGAFPRPKAVRLVRYVALSWRYAQPVRWSRRSVLKRDGFRCAYCGQRATTIDHIVPLSRGGTSTWLNTVAACGGHARSCNGRKANMLLDEAGMFLRHPPRVPCYVDLQRM